MNRILPYIFATLTQRNRHKVENIKWGKEWTYNLFRLWELIFWRADSSDNIGDTLRPESSICAFTENGKQVVFRQFFTWESAIVHAEGALRAFFKKPSFGFEFVPVAQFADVPGFSLPSPIFRFAIAYDNNIVQAGSSPQSASYTVTGSNPVLYGYSNDSAGDTLTGFTYNAVSLTFINKGLRPDGRESYLYVMAAPPTGAHTYTVTASGSPGALYLGGVSYSGAKQTGQPDASNVGTPSTSSSPYTLGITVVASNCWASSVLDNSSGSISVYVPSTLRGSFRDTNTTVSTGSYSLSITFTGTLNAYATVFSVPPEVAAVNSGFFLLF